MKILMAVLLMLSVGFIGCNGKTDTKPPIQDDNKPPAVKSIKQQMQDRTPVSKLKGQELDDRIAEDVEISTTADQDKKEAEDKKKADQEAAWAFQIRLWSSLVAVLLIIAAAALLYFFGLGMWKWAVSLIVFSVGMWGFMWFVASIIPKLGLIGGCIGAFILLVGVIAGIVVLYRKFVLHKELSKSLSTTLDVVESKFPVIKETKVSALMKSFADNELAGAKEADALRAEVALKTPPAVTPVTP